MLCPKTKDSCRESNEGDSGCAWWVVLKLNNKDVGRCTFAWLPILLVELRQAVEKQFAIPLGEGKKNG